MGQHCVHNKKSRSDLHVNVEQLKTIVMFINLLLIEDIKLVHAAIILTQSQVLSVECDFRRNRRAELCKFILICPRDENKRQNRKKRKRKTNLTPPVLSNCGILMDVLLLNAYLVDSVSLRSFVHCLYPSLAQGRPRGEEFKVRCCQIRRRIHKHRGVNCRQ